MRERAFAVIDDFLTPLQHRDLWAAFRERIASPITAPDWNRFCQAADGMADDEAVPILGAFSTKLSALMRDDPPISIDPWSSFSLSPWVYRPGMALNWHSDAAYLASYVYYAHPDWDPSWGGELLVAADGAPSAGDVVIGPRPNRLVLLRGGTLHAINKVESAVGDVFRASLSGFFFGAMRTQSE
jgi:hypothetical protein